MATPSKAAPGSRRTRIAPVCKEVEGPLTCHWRGEFLAALAETSNVTAAAAVAGVHPSRPYKVRRNEPEFARAWRDALYEGYENLEIELLQRLRFGEPRDEERKFDNASALRLLALHRETIVNERARRDHEDVALVRASLDAKIARFKQEVLARKTAEAATDD